MKTRTGFVSNSSSSSFCVGWTSNAEGTEPEDYIANQICPDQDSFFYGFAKEIAQYFVDGRTVDGWVKDREGSWYDYDKPEDERDEYCGWDQLRYFVEKYGKDHVRICQCGTEDFDSWDAHIQRYLWYYSDSLKFCDDGVETGEISR